MTDKVKIGSALKHKPQQYERRDPWPKVPFAVEYEDMPKWYWALVGAIIAAFVVAGATFHLWGQ